jgi:CDP-glucose 4,6-dehydratase
MTPSFWRGKKVFITGHTGFKGSWLTLWLQRLGADVVGFALPPSTEPSMFHLTRASDGITSIEGDVRDLAKVRAALHAHRPEIVIHMAAQALVKTAYADPVTTYTTNVVGTLNVLEAVRHALSVRVAVCITSDKCYQNDEWVWGYRENDRMGGHDPYSSSKGCAELLISAYRDSYFPPEHFAQHHVALASTRAGNVIGGGDWSRDRLVPDTMNAIMSGKPVLIRRPGAVRPWQFVLEPLRGYLHLAERLYDEPARFAGAWNFGPDIEQIKPVQWITDYLTRRWGGNASWLLDGATHPHEDHFLRLDCTKAKSILGWKPVMDLPTVLDWIVEWYRAYHSGGDLRAITEAQLERYESLALFSPPTEHEQSPMPVLPNATLEDLRGSRNGSHGQRLLAS